MSNLEITFNGVALLRYTTWSFGWETLDHLLWNRQWWCLIVHRFVLWTRGLSVRGKRRTAIPTTKRYTSGDGRGKILWNSPFKEISDSCWWCSYKPFWFPHFQVKIHVENRFGENQGRFYFSCLFELRWTACFQDLSCQVCSPHHSEIPHDDSRKTGPTDRCYFPESWTVVCWNFSWSLEIPCKCFCFTLWSLNLMWIYTLGPSLFRDFRDLPQSSGWRINTSANAVPSSGVESNPGSWASRVRGCDWIP